MALNPQYEAIGKAFTQQYYALFDDPAQRQQLTALYNVSLMFNQRPFVRCLAVILLPYVGTADGDCIFRTI